MFIPRTRLILLFILVVVLAAAAALSRAGRTAADEQPRLFQAVPPGSPLAFPGIESADVFRDSGEPELKPDSEAALAPQSGTSCQPLLYNPGLDYGYGWTIHFSEVVLDEGVYYTLPNSFRMIEDSDGQGNIPVGDYDAFYQVFNFPAQAKSFSLEMKVSYRGWSANDNVYYEFYTVDSAGDLSALIPGSGGTIPRYLANGAWHDIKVVKNYSTGLPSLMQGLPVALYIKYVDTDSAGNTGLDQMDIAIDEIQLRVCTSDNVPAGTIGGVVSQTGSSSPRNDARVVLAHKPLANPLKIIDTTFPEFDGTYEFEYVEGLTPGDSYQVWYLNDGTAETRLGLWAGRSINAFDERVPEYSDFDIADVGLISPTHEAEATFPTTFHWQDRGKGSDRFYLCIYDTDTLDQVCTSNPIQGTEVTITQSDLTNIPGSNFIFKYGRRYNWYVAVVDSSSYNSNLFANIGYSYGANAVTFVTTPSAVPSDPPPSGGSGLTGNSGADWTVMIYMAGDNNLGDYRRYYDPSLNLQGQFGALKQLAQSYPQVNLVTLTDFYDDSGTQYCHLKPDGSQECQQLGEQDTSDPMVLSTFISDTLASFAANRTMLVIADHGHSIAGVAADETTGRTAVMSPDEIRQAFSSAGLGSRKLDVLFFNACLMGSFEAAYDASSFADYMVASADELWVLSIYDRLLPLLSNPATKDDPAAVASGLVDAYEQAINAVAPGYFISSAAYDLSRLGSVNSAVSALGSTLATELSTSYAAIAFIRDHVQLYDSSGNYRLGPEDAFVDLAHLSRMLRDSSSNANITAAANGVLTALSGGGTPLIINSQQMSGMDGRGGNHDLTNADGLSIYFPNGRNGGEQPTMTNLYLNRGIYQEFVNQSQWDEFLRLYVTGVLNGGPGRLESAPGRLESATRPIDGGLPYQGEILLPVIIGPGQ